MSKQAFKRLRRRLKLEVNRKPLDAYAWPGGYPMLYVANDGAALCPDCVNAEIDSIDDAMRNNRRDGWYIVAFDINYEDDSCYCSHCNRRIESAYAEDETCAADDTSR